MSFRFRRSFRVSRKVIRTSESGHWRSDGPRVDSCAGYPRPGWAKTRMGRKARPLTGNGGKQAVDVQEIRKIEAYLRRLFGNPKIRVVPRPKKDDSVEVYIDNEFIAVISADEDEGDYNFNMSILGVDLE